MHGLFKYKTIRQIGLVFVTLLITITSSGQSAFLPEPEAPTCQFSLLTDDLLSLTGRTNWATWIAQLSGEQPVFIGGKFTRILTRYSPSMFDGQTNAQAYEYILGQLRRWYPDSFIEEDPYPFDGSTWKNIILNIPGTLQPEQVVVLSAHLDSVSEKPLTAAPGASDNGSGTAALLEAARILRHFRFEKSLRLIFFTGEEQGLIGSKAYVRDHDLQGIIGVINLDMFGFDQDNDRCFELHVGTLPESAPLGSCFLSAIQTYEPDLQTDFISAYDMGFSDHASFWDMNIGALEVLENYSYNSTTNGCLGLRDRNPYYHRSTDTLDKINLDTGFAIVRSTYATVSGLAHPQETCFDASPELILQATRGEIRLSWDALSGAETYRVSRSTHGCSSGWEILNSVKSPLTIDRKVNAGRIYSYQVEAVKDAGACVSIPSRCVELNIPTPSSQQRLEEK